MRIHDCSLLECLDISYGASPWKLLMERVPNIRTVNAENVDEIRLDRVCSLKSLALVRCNVSAANFSQFVTGGSLIQVELSNFRGDLAAALQDLGKITSLRELALRGTKLADGDVRRIGSFKQLEKLDLTCNDDLNDRLLRQLEGLTNLQVLKVWETHVTAAGAKRIESAIPGLHCVLVNPIPGVFSR